LWSGTTVKDIKDILCEGASFCFVGGRCKRSCVSGRASSGRTSRLPPTRRLRRTCARVYTPTPLMMAEQRLADLVDSKEQQSED